MDPQVEDTAGLVDQVPPPITLTTDSNLSEPGTATTVTVQATSEESTEPSTDLRSNLFTGPPSQEPQSENLPDAPQGEAQTISQSDRASDSQHAQPELEHAYWAEFEEDSSVPDEAEMKEIESAADGDYSAYEYDYWEKNFHADLDDPEYRPTQKARLTWKIKGIRGSPDRPNRAKIMRSLPAYMGGYWWTIKFFPRGNNVSSLSVYIECSPTMPTPEKSYPDTEFKVLQGPAGESLDTNAPEVDIKFAETEDTAAWLEQFKAQYPAARQENAAGAGSWRVSAQIGVILYNPDEPRTGWMQSSCHQFNPHNLDWGWTNFHGPWDQIHRRQRGQRQALLRHDTLAFDAYIRIVDDPTRSLWWHASDTEPTWDSLSLTGYRPLGDSVINHSAEVAGLATWMHLAPFCRIIQKANVLEHLSNCDVKPKPLCDALQKFLWQLRSRGQSLQYVDTDLITSTLRNLHEYSGDVCEFWERLRRTLEIELEGTDAARELAELFDSPSVDSLPIDVQGEGVINTIPKDYNSRICVPADQVKTTSEAFSQYLNAKSGRWVLPPILHLELGRQSLDKAARQWRLLYNRVELDEELDLTPWLLDGLDGKYVLYGYIVHRGRRTSGKFFSILRPGGPGTRWLAFDDGSDNRVECLTRKTALGPHLGLDASQKPDHKTGHDVAIAVMYIRSDVVQDYLPGAQGPWEVPASLKQYYETGTYLLAPTEKDEIEVEVYSLPKYDQLGSLFDTYDLMAQAKTANSVMYLTVPRSSNYVDLRKKIALWASIKTEQATSPEYVRLWQVGHTRAQSGPTLAFARITDLSNSLELPAKTARFWMEIVSDADAKLFAIADPQQAIAIEAKPEEAILERDGSESSEDRQSLHEIDSAQPSSSGNIPEHLLDNSTPEPVPVEININANEQSAEVVLENQMAEAVHVENTSAGDENDAVIAAIIAEDLQLQQMEVEGREHVPEPVSAVVDEPNDTTSDVQIETVVNVDAPPTLPEPDVPQPVEHVYYFIQVFDIEAQILRTVGSFFSKKEENIKAAIRKHLKWAPMKDFQVWQRVDGTNVTTMASGETFETFVPDGTCFIVGDKINKDRRLKLSIAGMFANPDHLVRYLWAASRNHPTRAFTGHKTIEATFTSEYYSGQFMKGYFHGKGKHISDLAATYDGDFVLGKRHGSGFMEYPIGDTYNGDWFEGICHGQGTFVERKTGNKYVGGYKDGKRHGKGISYWEVADEEMDLCQICYGEEQDALFYDCGHVCACVTCARQVDLCPICRKSIVSVVKIYRT
ncbi:putative MATH and UCH domain protein [Aspergillus homomorphus CBS 101889]|uniref:MATH and UCH domain protein n=1 Tax=Aspergillus homomorphus (strain CBS 101889) TaxID=1450537 RepID=A0A395HTR2_ASPHC|nr:MATH and UCH domain protein [Aspergillus homomorphus CBS 101889]RAL11180.1 MATH and UCH domain protein [Aspergillus homomorphus CBS 101889]